MRGVYSIAVAVLAAAAGSALAPAPAQAAYSFQTLNNNADPTFNQLLGINSAGEVAGYFGSGAAGHPNKGYTVVPPYGQGDYTNENFPGSVQTQVTGLNNAGVTVGFWSNSNFGPPNDANFGFVKVGNMFTNVNNPATPGGGIPINQLLGVNNSNVAVGFYNDAAGNANGYTYNIGSATFVPVNNPAATATTAAAINNLGQIAGFFVDATGTHGFLDIGGVFTTLDAPGASATMLTGINDNGLLVGVDTVGAATHGVIYDDLTHSWISLDDPLGIDATTFNGINDLNQIVGFYTDANGNVDGLLATPVPTPEPASLLLIGSGLLGLSLLRRRRRG